jgi:hypothetical protein
MDTTINTNVNDPKKSFAGPGDKNTETMFAEGEINKPEPEEFPQEPAENDPYPYETDLTEHDIVSEEMRISTHRF